MYFLTAVATDTSAVYESRFAAARAHAVEPLIRSKPGLLASLVARGSSRGMFCTVRDGDVGVHAFQHGPLRII